jgi:hypothetical protein
MPLLRSMSSKRAHSMLIAAITKQGSLYLHDAGVVTRTDTRSD